MFRILDIFQKKVLVLMYHRIANDEVDPWEIAVSAENFEAHLKILKKYNIIPFSELASQIQAKNIKSRSVVITFDDGYEDNFTTAKPLLEKYQVPATFFITSRNIGKEDEFWWDELARIILTTEILPQKFQITLKDNSLQFDLKEEAQLNESLYNHHQSYSIYRSTPTLRAHLYYMIWEKLYSLDYAEQEQLMTFIRAWANVPKSKRKEYMCMSKKQIQELANSSLFTIGAHTSTHPALSFFDKERQYEEIEGNKRFLEELTGSPVDFFAFPSGNFNDNTIEAARKAGLKACVTTHHKPNSNKSDPFLLGRFQVNNWNAQILRSRLKAWFKQ